MRNFPEKTDTRELALFALDYTANANKYLKPETSNGYEVGARGTFANSFYTVGTFYDDYDDFIESLEQVGAENGLIVFQSRNLASARICGVEDHRGRRETERQIERCELAG